jgi:hypothetical protein
LELKRYEEKNNMYSLRHAVRVNHIGHAANVGDVRTAYNILIMIPEAE